MSFAPWQTLRGRIILAALVVEFVMLAILLGNSMRLLRDAMGDQAREQAMQIAPILSAAVVAPMAQYDYATVQAILDESHAVRGVDYLAITDVGGTIIAASGWPTGRALPAVDQSFSLDEDPPRYDYALAISLSGQRLGTLQFGLDLSKIVIARNNLLLQGVLISGSELLLSAGLLTILGLLITRQLSQLTQASLRVAEGDLTPEPVPEGPDDIGRLGAAFNIMSRTIGERIDQLMQANFETARMATVLKEKNVELEKSDAVLRAENERRLQTQNELEKALLSIRDHTEQLNAIFDLSPDGFVSFSADHCVAFANPAFLRMTGFALDEILDVDEKTFVAALGAKCRNTSELADIAVLLASWTAAVDRQPEGDAAERASAVIELAGPTLRQIHVGARRSSAENVSKILYFRDITREVELDQMKSEFLSTAAHELRTPMASILGYSELLLNQEFDAEMQKDLLTTVYRNSVLIAKIIDELLDLARIEARRGKDFTLERLVLQDMVHETVASFLPPDERPKPILQLDPLPVTVTVDRRKIRQALLNVISNAYKYSPEGGDVTISSLRVYKQGRDWIGIEIRDRGIGMTPEQAARVCERFYRADTSGRIPGTGLGMSIVKEIMELSEGRVDIASASGSGTSVTLWLPVAGA